MRLEWLDDLLAVLETDSLSAAAARRCLSQPAFSRRLRVIEEQVGARVVDRSSKPARVLPALSDQQDRIRELAAGLRELVHELRRHVADPAETMVIASQHALTTTLVPTLVRHLDGETRACVRLRSENHSECEALLLTRQVHLALTYRSARDASPSRSEHVQEVVVSRERFVPVIARSAVKMLKAARAEGELPIVAYPSEVFLGQVFARELQPRLPDAPFVRRQAETALTLAALQLAAAGVGVAWVPYSLAERDLAARTIVNLSSSLPHCDLEIVAARLAGTASIVQAAVWKALQTLCLG